MNKFKLITVLLLQVFVLNHVKAKNADMVIFSFDRPIQLYSLLESIERYVTGVNNVQVVYRVTDQSYNEGYEIVKSRFKNVVYRKQGSNPRQDFKIVTRDAFFDGQSEYIIFAVDDIIVKDFVNLSECIDALERYGAYGFYLRLGLNLTECYMMNRAQPIPPIHNHGNDVLSWQMSQGMYDWAYPHTVDMTLFRKSDVSFFVTHLTYHSPNTFEAEWHNHSAGVMRKRGLCFTESKIVNTPLNLVQQDYVGNRHMEEMSAKQLLELFLQGLKIDIQPLHKIKNKGAHMEYHPQFITRD